MPAGRSGGGGISTLACMRVTNPRGDSGVPVGTLTLVCLIRGLQTPGYSCGVVSPLCLRRGMPCRTFPALTCRRSVTRVEWLRHSCLTAGVYHTWSGFAALTCRRGGGADACGTARVPGCGVSPLACPRVTNPRGDSGVPIGTLTLVCLIRGLQPPGYSCGVVSPLCLRREGGYLRGGRVERGCLWCGVA